DERERDLGVAKLGLVREGLRIVAEGRDRARQSGRRLLELIGAVRVLSVPTEVEPGPQPGSDHLLVGLLRRLLLVIGGQRGRQGQKQHGEQRGAGGRHRAPSGKDVGLSVSTRRRWGPCNQHGLFSPDRPRSAWAAETGTSPNVARGAVPVLVPSGHEWGGRGPRSCPPLTQGDCATGRRAQKMGTDYPRTAHQTPIRTAANGRDDWHAGFPNGRAPDPCHSPRARTRPGPTPSSVGRKRTRDRGLPEMSRLIVEV